MAADSAIVSILSASWPLNEKSKRNVDYGYFFSLC